MVYILQEQAVTARIPIIYLTALFSKHEEAKYGNLVGGNKTMAKPYEIPRLVSEIKDSLRQATAMTSLD